MRVLQFSLYYYRPKRSFGQGSILTPVCHSFCSQGGEVPDQAPSLAGTHPLAGPPGQVHPLWADASPLGRYTPWQVHPPLGRYSPWAGTPPMGRYSPWAGTSPGRYTLQAGTPPPIFTPVCHSFCSQGGEVPDQAPPLAGTHPPGRSPRAGTPPLGRCIPPGQVHPWQVHPPLGRYTLQAGTPPMSRYSPRAGTPPGRYTPQAGTPPPWAGTPPVGRYTPPWQVHPSGSYTPLAGTPPGQEQPPGQLHPPGQVHPPGRYPHPPGTADSGIRSTFGRYASYWNALLLRVKIRRLADRGPWKVPALNVVRLLESRYKAPTLINPLKLPALISVRY